MTKITFIQCKIDETAGLVDTSQDNPYDNEPGYQEHVAEATKHCKCDLLWSPCEGVLAGGVCDEICEDEYDREAWDWGEDEGEW